MKTLWLCEAYRLGARSEWAVWIDVGVDETMRGMHNKMERYVHKHRINWALTSSRKINPKILRVCEYEIKPVKARKLGVPPPGEDR
jgi:hypothetical protein